MVITKIEKYNKRNRIYIDDVYMFSLYDNEVRNLHICQDDEINDEKISKIKDIVRKRGNKYIYQLLNRRDYTKQELIQKLVMAGYLQEEAEEWVNSVEEKGLINDIDYAKRYIEQMSEKKSKMQILATLTSKGIDQDAIYSLLQDEEGEYEAAKNLLLKRLKGKTDLTYEEKGKIFQYLLRKGFSYNIIDRVMDDLHKYIDNL